MKSKNTAKQVKILFSFKEKEKVSGQLAIQRAKKK